MSYSTFLSAYVECLVWQASEDDISAMHHGADLLDFDPASRVDIQTDCQAFYDANRELWADGWTDEQAGHDFALTRNGHGAGFWDRYWGADDPRAVAGDVLADAARVYGESSPMLADDGSLFV